MLPFYFSHVQIYVSLICNFIIQSSKRWLSPAPILNIARACFLTHRFVELLFEKESFTAHLVILRSRFIYRLIQDVTLKSHNFVLDNLLPLPNYTLLSLLDRRLPDLKHTLGNLIHFLLSHPHLPLF